MSDADSNLIKRLSIVCVFVFVFTAAFAKLHAVYSEKFFQTTVDAQWIWAQHRMSDNVPVAFFAARDFDLPKNRLYTHLKVLGDPEYTLYFNGVEVAGRRVGEERQIDFYDLSALARDGKNRLVIAVRAPQGVGGLLAAVDIGPEAESFVVSDRQWKIYRRYSPQLVHRDPPGLRWEAPQIVGEPPIGRWNYLKVSRRKSAPPPSSVRPPLSSFPVRAMLPTIRTRSGIAVAIAEPVRATAFDFGPAQRGRVRISAGSDHPIASRLINVRFVNLPEELTAVEWSVRPVVLAPGESMVTTPEEHQFRYVLVYSWKARAEMVN